jgi:hypothetical protein
MLLAQCSIIAQEPKKGNAWVTSQQATSGVASRKARLGHTLVDRSSFRRLICPSTGPVTYGKGQSRENGRFIPLATLSKDVEFSDGACT